MPRQSLAEVWQTWLQALGRGSVAAVGDDSEKRCQTGDGSENCYHGRRRQEEDGRERLQVLGKGSAATAGDGSKKRFQTGGDSENCCHGRERQGKKC